MMIEQEAEPRLLTPAWYWAVAMAALLFEAVGCYAYTLDVTRTAAEIAALPIDQRALIQARPFWITGAYGVAVWIGLLGAIGLLLRREFAVPALLVSLIAIAIQFGGILLVPDLRNLLSSDDLAGPVVIILLAYGFWQFAKIARGRGWMH